MRKYLLAVIWIISASFLAFAQENKQDCPNISLSGPEGLTRVGEEITVKAINSAAS